MGKKYKKCHGSWGNKKGEFHIVRTPEVIRMIIFLYGADDYRREEKKRWYVGEFKKKHSGLAVQLFDFSNAEKDNLADFQNFARSQSLFSADGGYASGAESKKLAVLENIYQADEEKLSKALHEVVAKKATIVLCSEKEEPAKTFRFLLKNPVIFQKFDYLLGYEWEKFIRVEAKKFGLNLRDTALRLLAEIYKENTWGLITEFQKLSTLKSGEISGEDLDKLGLEVSPNYWAMLDGLKSSNLAGRLVALEKLFGAEEPMPKVFNILSSQWREKTSLMAEYDLKVKSGKMDYEECLLDLVLG